MSRTTLLRAAVWPETEQLRSSGEATMSTSGRASVGCSERALTLAREGDRAAWEQIYERCYPGVHRHLRYLVHDSDLAGELAQETFVRAIGSIHRYNGSGNLTTWLHGIALNLARTHWRKQSTTRRAREKLSRNRGAGPLGGDALPDDDLLYRRRYQVLLLAIEQLPERLRVAFVLREMEALSGAEASVQLGISPTNVTVRVSRAKRAISKLLATWGWLEQPENES